MVQAVETAKQVTAGVSKDWPGTAQDWYVQQGTSALVGMVDIGHLATAAKTAAFENSADAKT